MGLLNFLKNIFKSKPKMLPEPTTDITATSDWRQNQKLPYTPKVNTIDEAIYQYITNYFSFSPTTNNHSYNTLVSLNAITNDEQGNNGQLERILLNKIWGDFSYEMYEQKSNVDDITAFYHVSKNDAVEGDLRLYINCKQKNIAMLVDEILTGMSDDEIYLKFMSNQNVSKSFRSENIVIYTNSKDAAKIIDVINGISSKKPELFEDSDKMNPFLKKATPFVAVAPNPVTSNYIDLNGNSHKIPRSYNSFLATALEESLKYSLIDIVAKDLNLTTQTNGTIGDMNQYRKIYPTICSDYMEDLINGMKDGLAILKERNALDIELNQKNSLDDKEHTI